MTPGSPTPPPTGGPPPPAVPEPPTAPPPPAACSVKVPRYFLFQGPLVDEKTKADDARRIGMYYFGWEAFVCCSDGLEALLAWVEESIDESELRWQIVDITNRIIVYSSYDPRPRH